MDPETLGELCGPSYFTFGEVVFIVLLTGLMIWIWGYCIAQSNSSSQKHYEQWLEEQQKLRKRRD